MRNISGLALSASFATLMVTLALPNKASAQATAAAQSRSMGDAGPPTALPVSETPQKRALVTTDPQASTSDAEDTSDIVMTAQRRSESLQKVSVALSVISLEVLARAGVTQSQALSTVLPGIQFFEAAFQPGVVGASIAPPRIYGVRFAMNFR